MANRQVVSRALFLQVGGCQVDGDAAHGEFAAAISQGSPNTLPGFLHCRVGQSHHIKARHAWRQVHLHTIYEAFQSDHGA